MLSDEVSEAEGRGRRTDVKETLSPFVAQSKDAARHSNRLPRLLGHAKEKEAEPVLPGRRGADGEQEAVVLLTPTLEVRAEVEQGVVDPVTRGKKQGR